MAEEPAGAAAKKSARFARFRRPQKPPLDSSGSSMSGEKDIPPTEKWSLGILSDKKTEEVPGGSDSSS